MIRPPAPTGPASTRVRAGIIALLMWSLASVAAAGVGQPAPPCVFRMQDGQRVALNQLKGKVIYVDFWASWCTSCILSFPFLNSLQDSYAQRGLVVVGVVMDQRAEDARRFLVRHPGNFAIATGDNHACAIAFGVAAMPSSYVIDRSGVVRAAHQGFRAEDGKALTALVGKLVSEPSR